MVKNIFMINILKGVHIVPVKCFEDKEEAEKFKVDLKKEYPSDFVHVKEIPYVFDMEFYR